MVKLNLETKTKEHELIKAYLEENEITLKNKIVKKEKNPLIEVFGSENYSNDEIMQDTDGSPMYLGYQNGYLYVGNKINNMVVSKYQVKYNEKLDFNENFEKLYYKVYPKQNKKEEIKETPKNDVYIELKEKYPEIIILTKKDDGYEACGKDAEMIFEYIEIELKNNKVIIPNDKYFNGNLLVISFYTTVGIIENDILTIIPKFDSKENEYKMNLTTGEILQ